MFFICEVDPSACELRVDLLLSSKYYKVMGAAWNGQQKFILIKN
jgi:hypothetical protein